MGQMTCSGFTPAIGLYLLCGKGGAFTSPPPTEDGPDGPYHYPAIVPGVAVAPNLDPSRGTICLR
jgi:hypothetical protein